MMAWLFPASLQASDRSRDERVLIDVALGKAPGRGAAKPKVLVVDDERLVADTLAEILNQNGFEAMAAYSAEAALRLADALAPDILLTDVLMPQVNGVQLAASITQSRPQVKVILISGQTGISTLVQNARNEGHTFALLPKPIHPHDLLNALRDA